MSERTQASPQRAKNQPATPRRRWCLGTRLLVAAAVLWLAFVLAHRLLSGRLWLWTAVDMLPPPAFLAVPLSLLAAIPLVRLTRVRLPESAVRTVVVAVALATVLGAGDAGLNLAALDARAAAVPADTGDLRVVSWNTQYWDQADDSNRFYTQLKAHPADVYLLQEYLFWSDGPVQINRLARLRHEFPGYEIVAIGELVTLSRLPIVATSAPGAAPNAAQDFAQAYQTAKILRTDIRFHGRALSLYNVHITVPVDADRNPLTPGFYSIIADRQAQRERQFRALRDDLRRNGGPRLIAGDFNTSPAMGDLRRLGGGLIDAAAASQSPFVATWPASGPVLWRLDWAFTDSSVHVHNYRTADPAGLSDHRMQEIQLAVEDR